MITEFKDKYRWLSNFAECSIELDCNKYRSVEHAYMSAKSDDLSWKAFCTNTINAGTVKRASRGIKLVSGWDAKKIQVMRHCVDQKFSQEPYKSLLLNTKNEYIQEGNLWGDKFWGIDLRSGEGLNFLGFIIMETRHKLIVCEM